MRHQRAVNSAHRHPIRQPQAPHPVELSTVVADQGDVQRQRVGGNLGVEEADRRARGHSLGADEDQALLQP